jgi:hypothetical protein
LPAAHVDSLIRVAKTGSLFGMGEIKSALELALEKTADVKSDKRRVREHEAKQDGMRLAGRYLADPSVDVKGELKTSDNRSATRLGFFQVMLSHLALPTQEADLERLTLVQKGLEQAIPDRFVTNVMDQVKQLLQQFLDTKNQVTERLRDQFLPRLQQREEQIAQQTGRRIKLDPSSDPEFVKALNDSLKRLQRQYGQVIDQARDQLTQLFESQQ